MSCYCLEAPDKCPRAGTMDLFQCIATPIVISLPHFYKADPEILKELGTGLNPNKEEHAVFLHFESVSFNSPLKQYFLCFINFVDFIYLLKKI